MKATACPGCLDQFDVEVFGVTDVTRAIKTKATDRQYQFGRRHLYPADDLGVVLDDDVLRSQFVCESCEKPSRTNLLAQSTSCGHAFCRETILAVHEPV